MASGMTIISAPKTTPLVTSATLRTNAASPIGRRKTNCHPCRTATMTRNIAMAAAHAHAAAGLAFQLASASPIPITGKVDAARDTIELSVMSDSSFDGPLGKLVVTDASGPRRFKAPPERLSKAEQRLLQDRHDQPIGDRPPGFFRVDEARLLQHREVGRHGRLRDGELVRQFSR